MTNSDLSNLPEPEQRDKLHKLVTELVEVVVPLPYAGDLIALLIKPTYDKRQKEWLQQLANDLVSLQKRVADFNIENLIDNPLFVTAVMELTLIAVRTPQEEKLTALRNAALNAALPSAPDSTKQKMFFRWADEMTPTHIRILRIFNDPRVPSLNFDNNSWKQNINLGKLGLLIEETYPDMVGNYEMHIQIIKELYDSGLISNVFPALRMMNRIEHSPKITLLGKEFLQFLDPPLGKIS